MTVELDRHRRAMLRRWGEDIAFGAETFRAIFDDEHREDLDVSSTRPQLTVETKDVDDLGIARGDTVTRGTTSYTVRDIQPDGTGITLLDLEAQ